MGHDSPPSFYNSSYTDKFPFQKPVGQISCFMKLFLEFESEYLFFPLLREVKIHIDFYSFKVLDNMVSNISLNCAFFLFFVNCIDPTRIILAPINADITVGENATMQCAASFDPALDLTFIWSFNGYVIDFNKENIHYQRNFMVCVLSFILLTFQ